MVTAQIYSQFQGLTVAPEDIQLNETDAQEVLLNFGGRIIKSPVSRKTLQITIRGVQQDQAEVYLRAAIDNRRLATTGNLNVEDISIAGITLRAAALFKATASEPVEIEGTKLCETLQLEYQSLYLS